MKTSSASTNSSVWRFFAEGVADVDRRVRRFTARPASGFADRDLVPVIEASTPARWISAAHQRVTAAASSSMLWATVTGLTARIKYGPVIVIAAITHIALVAVEGPVGWLWLLLPVTGAAAGVLLWMSDQS